MTIEPRFPRPKFLLEELLLIGWSLLGTGYVWADLHFDGPLADVGEVKAGVPLSRRFDFRNEGPNQVEILEARASCGCLTPKLAKRFYEPGEAGFFLLEINTLSEPAGPHQWTVHVAYRDGDRRNEQTIALSARVITEITLQPAALTVFANGGVGHSILLTDLRPKPLGVAEVRTTSPRLRAKLADEYRDKAGHVVRKIKLEVADDYPEGRHQEAVTLFTDDPTYRELKVPVTIIKQSRQRVQVSPNPAILVGQAGRPIPSRVLLVRDWEGQGVEIEKVVADHPGIHCTWARGPGAMATVKIIVDGTRLTGDVLNSAIHIHVAKPVAEVVTIPLTCTVR